MTEMRFKVRLVKGMSILKPLQPIGLLLILYKGTYKLGVDDKPRIYSIHSRCDFCVSAFTPASVSFGVLWLSLPPPIRAPQLCLFSG